MGSDERVWDVGIRVWKRFLVGQYAGDGGDSDAFVGVPGVVAFA